MSVRRPRPIQLHLEEFVPGHENYPPVYIRSLRASDVKGVAEVFQKNPDVFTKDEVKDAAKEAYALAKSKFAERRATGSGAYVAAQKRTHRVLGYGSYSKDFDNNYWVGWLAVSPDSKGKGFGKKILSKIEDLASARGAAAVRVDTSDTNYPAQEFYRKMGYAATNFVPEGEERPADNINFVKPLEQPQAQRRKVSAQA